MMQKIFLGLFFITVLGLFSLGTRALSADSASASFTIPTSVISSGGIQASESESFILRSTIGQATPLMEHDAPPLSQSFDHYPGFWYSVGPEAGCGAIIDIATNFGTIIEKGTSPVCCDYDFDGDVDGRDLYKFTLYYVSVEK